jgi:glycine/D-amino acid oxidase-like deaminating enzyme
MKTGLIIGGGVLGLFVVYMLAKAHAAQVITTGTGTGTSVVPGSSGGGTGTSGGSRSLLGKFYDADKNVLSTTYNVTKSIVTLGGLL